MSLQFQHSSDDDGARPATIPFAAVVLAILAFFALRPGKGWMRRKPLPATLEDGSNGNAKLTHEDSSTLGSRPSDSSMAGNLPRPASDGKAGALLALPAAVTAGRDQGPDRQSNTCSTLGPDTFMTFSNSTDGAATTRAAVASAGSLGLDTFLPYDTASAGAAPFSARVLPAGGSAAADAHAAPQPGPQPLPPNFATSPRLTAAAATSHTLARAPQTASRSSSRWDTQGAGRGMGSVAAGCHCTFIPAGLYHALLCTCSPLLQHLLPRQRSRALICFLLPEYPFAIGHPAAAATS